MTKKESEAGELIGGSRIVEDAIRIACDRRFGVLEGSFLCESVSCINPPQPICVSETETVAQVLTRLREAKIGCVLVVDDARKLIGIFSERDCILKVVENFAECVDKPISAVMTPAPVAQPPDTTIAFALNLMSHGGFRHLPLIDANGVPVGIISVKDIVDHIVERFLADVHNLRLDL